MKPATIFYLCCCIIILVPTPSQAYLIPLVGVGGVLITMCIGIIAAVCAALFLILYNLRRLLRKWLWKRPVNHTDEDMQPPAQ